MRKSFTVIMLGAICLASAAAQADGLFSEVSIGSPFGADETQGALPAQPAPQRVAGAPSLSQMLGQAGLQAKEFDGRVVGVTVEAGGTSVPVLLTFTEEDKQIRMVMVLSVLKEGQTLSTDTLIAMMDANRENSSVLFAFSKKQRRTELHRIINNSSLTPSRLKDELAAMVSVAEQSKEIWNVPQAETQTPPQSGVAATPEAKPEATPTQPTTAPAAQPRQNTVQLSLVGQWTAVRSKTEAFALRIDQAGTFALVTVVSGKTSQSKGKFTVEDSKMTLIDEKGTQLAGTVTLNSGKEFSFQPTGAKTALTFKKAG